MYLSSWNYLSTDEKVMAVCTILPPDSPVDTVLKVFESFETKSCSREEVSLCHAEWVRCGCVGLSGDIVNSQRHAPLSRPTCVRCRFPPLVKYLERNLFKVCFVEARTRRLASAHLPIVSSLHVRQVLRVITSYSCTQRFMTWLNENNLIGKSGGEGRIWKIMVNTAVIFNTAVLWALPNS